MATNTLWVMLDSSGIGGIETHVTSLVIALRKRALNVEIVLMGRHGVHPLSDTWAKTDIPVRIIEGGVSGLISALREARPLLVHTHGYKAGIFGKGLCKLLQIPVVSTYHAGEPGTGKVRFYNSLDFAMARLAPHIAVSPPIAKRAGDRATLIPNFVDVPDVMALGGQTVAFVGRLSHEKGPDRFIALAKELADLPFDVFGDGPERADMERLAPSSVCFWGSVPSMQNYWKSIGLLCISSRHEGLPLVALEAMSHGVPIAAFAVGALPDLIEDGLTGFIAPAGDMNALADSVRRWRELGDSQKIEMSMRARSHIQDHYASDVVSPRIIDVYERAIKNTGGDLAKITADHHLCSPS